MATAIMALLYALEGAILTVTAVVTGIKHSDIPIVLFFILLIISIGSVLLIPAHLLKTSTWLKKKVKTVIRNILIATFVIVAVGIGWLCAYYNSQNADNLPALENLQNEDLDDLVGYKRGQLISVWEQPDDTISINQDVWRLKGEEYLNIFLMLLLHEKPVSDTYYRDQMDGLTHVFEIPEDTIARYAGVSVDELNEFEKSDKREHIERCIAHLFITFMRDSRFTCEDGPWMTMA